MTDKNWKREVDEWKTTHISMADYCRQKDLSYWSFRSWKTKLEVHSVPLETPDLVKLSIPPSINAYLPSGLFGEAVSYTLNRWDVLRNYLDLVEATPDNNPVENAIRSFVVGRKNWLFSASPRGASASAFLYSLVETVKANSLEPYFYLRYLFQRFPSCPPIEWEKLMPWNLNPQDLIIRD